MKFRKYMHIERIGTSEVRDLERGTIYIFSKIDGSNASTYIGDDGIIKAASRNHELNPANTNRGFYNYVVNNANLIEFHRDFPNYRLYGEWLCSHTIKTYQDDAWQKFYIFDVYYCSGGIDEFGEANESPISYDIYKPLLEQYGLDYIPVLKVIQNGDYDDFIKELENNTYLIKENNGVGEGVVLKNYDFANKYGRTIWGKIITSEFTETKIKNCQPKNIAEGLVENDIVEKFVTTAFIEKEYSKIKIVNDDEWSSKLIPRLLQNVYYEFVKEECWNFVKEFKFPTINFKTLRTILIMKIKNLKPELF